MAELFDPLSGEVIRTDLGATTGDLASVHAFAAEDGGLLASWRTSSGVVAELLDAHGGLWPKVGLPGELAGVDDQGRAISVYEANGTWHAQACTLSEGFFLHG